MVRCYSWCSNEMRDQQLKRSEPEGGAADAGGESARTRRLTFTPHLSASD
jgi:hypothetical protein